MSDQINLANHFSIENAGHLSKVVQFITQLNVSSIGDGMGFEPSTHVRSGPNLSVLFRWSKHDLIITQKYLGGDVVSIAIDFYDYDDHIRRAVQALKAEIREKDVIALVSEFFYD